MRGGGSGDDVRVEEGEVRGVLSRFLVWSCAVCFCWRV